MGVAGMGVAGVGGAGGGGMTSAAESFTSMHPPQSRWSSTETAQSFVSPACAPPRGSHGRRKVGGRRQGAAVKDVKLELAVCGVPLFDEARTRMI